MTEGLRASSRDRAQELVEQYAKEHGARWLSEDVVERRKYWFFPVGYIGSIGVFVDKATGALTSAGSAYDLETWSWGYERGLLAEPTNLTVTNISDAHNTLELLLHVLGAGPARLPNPNPKRRWLRDQLGRLPATFPDENLTLRIPSFREAVENGWFEFEAKEG